ncbi:MAG: galactonate dehydratase, partial [Clostridiales bacterium]|nr:galactonate dehydratase [Clostridiales bacterium]
LEKHAATVLQPDICHCGGIFEAKKIAAMAEAYHCSVAPHNPLGPISLAACIQADACIPNFLIQEHPGMEDGRDRGVGYLKEPIVIKDSYVELTDKPGLGIEVDEDFVRAHIFEGNWDTPRLFHTDGSVAQW